MMFSFYIFNWSFFLTYCNLGLADAAAVAARNHSSTVNVPSELLLQLLDVSRSVQKLLPTQLTRKGIDSDSRPEDESDGGYSSLLALALRHHSLLQRRNEDLLTQHARCTAQVEALKEDKEELRLQIQEQKQHLRQLMKGEALVTSIDVPEEPITEAKETTTSTTTTTTPTPTTPTTTTKVPSTTVDDTCLCEDNLTTGHLDGDVCICRVEIITTTFIPPTTTTTEMETPSAALRVRDCAGHQSEGATQSGVYEIYPSQCHAVQAYCDMDTDGGGWTVFLNREEEPEAENFTRNWQDYRDGFGDPQGEFWLGNEAIHELTAKDEHFLRVDAEDFYGDRRWGVWERFRVADEDSNYELKAVLYSTNSTLGDGLLWHSGMQFSTVDRDNDKHAGSCAEEYKGGWWYNVCHNANPTGILANSEDFDSVGWVYWSPRHYKWASLKRIQMKIRPKAYGTPDAVTAPRGCSSA